LRGPPQKQNSPERQNSSYLSSGHKLTGVTFNQEVTLLASLLKNGNSQHAIKPERTIWLKRTTHPKM
jgi:hypothetical protein